MMYTSRRRVDYLLYPNIDDTPPQHERVGKELSIFLSGMYYVIGVLNKFSQELKF